MTHDQRLHLLVLAAGRGARVGVTTPKQFAEDAHGVSILAHSLSRATRDIRWHSITIGAPAASISHTEKIVASLALGNATVVPGSTHRMETLRRVVARIDADVHDVCVVHDGVRPLTPPELFGDVVAALGCPDVDVCWPMSPPRDTTVLTHATHGPRVVPATQVAVVATPIAVRFPVLAQAVSTSSDESPVLTDRLLRMGARWTHVDNSWWNLKVTTREDLEAVMHLLSAGPV